MFNMMLQGATIGSTANHRFGGAAARRQYIVSHIDARVNHGNSLQFVVLSVPATEMDDNVSNL